MNTKELEKQRRSDNVRLLLRAAHAEKKAFHVSRKDVVRYLGVVICFVLANWMIGILGIASELIRFLIEVAVWALLLRMNDYVKSNWQ